MANFSQFDVITKDGAIGGYLSLTALVPELKTGLFLTISTGNMELLPNFNAVYNITPFFAVPLVYNLMNALNSDPYPPVPSNANDFTGSVSAIELLERFRFSLLACCMLLRPGT